MGFLSRKARAAEPERTESAPRIVHREIEITVEREWTSVTARAQSVETVPEPASGEQQAEASTLELPPFTKRE